MYRSGVGALLESPTWQLGETLISVCAWLVLFGLFGSLVKQHRRAARMRPIRCRPPARAVRCGGARPVPVIGTGACRILVFQGFGVCVVRCKTRHSAEKRVDGGSAACPWSLSCTPGHSSCAGGLPTYATETSDKFPVTTLERSGTGAAQRRVCLLGCRTLAVGHPCLPRFLTC